MIRLLETLAVALYNVADLLELVPRRLNRAGNACSDTAHTLRTLEAELAAMVREQAGSA